MDDELAFADLIAEWGPTPHPHALLARGGDLVADALPNDLRLALGVQRVELHLQAILAGFAGIDRAAQFAGHAMQVGAAGMPVSGTTAGSAQAMMFGARQRHVRPG